MHRDDTAARRFLDSPLSHTYSQINKLLPKIVQDPINSHHLHRNHGLNHQFSCPNYCSSFLLMLCVSLPPTVCSLVHLLKHVRSYDSLPEIL